MGLFERGLFVPLETAEDEERPVRPDDDLVAVDRQHLEGREDVRLRAVVRVEGVVAVLFREGAGDVPQRRFGGFLFALNFHQRIRVVPAEDEDKGFLRAFGGFGGVGRIKAIHRGLYESGRAGDSREVAVSHAEFCGLLPLHCERVEDADCVGDGLLDVPTRIDCVNAAADDVDAVVVDVRRGVQPRCVILFVKLQDFPLLFGDVVNEAVPRGEAGSGCFVRLRLRGDDVVFRAVGVLRDDAAAEDVERVVVEDGRVGVAGLRHGGARDEGDGAVADVLELVGPLAEVGAVGAVEVYREAREERDERDHMDRCVARGILEGILLKIETEGGCGKWGLRVFRGKSKI